MKNKEKEYMRINEANATKQDYVTMAITPTTWKKSAHLESDGTVALGTITF